MKKILVLTAVLFLCLSLSSCKKKELQDDIYIFFTSDVHCGVDENISMASLKALVKDTKAEHQHVLLVDVGDYIQGGTIGSISKGELIIELMNDMGYDIVTFGNHEFDYGMERLSALIGMMNFDKIASNVIYTGKKENIFEDVPEYITMEFDGVKVGFIGVLTPGSYTSSMPKYFMEDGEFVYNFYDGDNGKQLAEKVQSLVDEMRKQGTDYVVALTHLGSTEANVPYDSISLIHNTSGIDVVLDGHSHSLIVEDHYPNKNGEDVLLSSVGTKLQTIGELIIGKDGTITTIHVDEYAKEDEQMRADLKKVEGKLDTILLEEVGETAFDLKITDDEGIRMSRSREVTTADFVADAFREACDADIALINGGAVRSDLLTGKVTYGDLLSIMPFANNVKEYQVSGQMIINALEYGSKAVSSIYKLDGQAVGEFGGFLQVSGLKYSIDTSIASAVTVDDKGMFNGFSSDERRVKEVYILQDGEYVAIDPNKEYTMATIDYFVSESGDGNTAFKDANIIEDDGLIDVDVLRQFFDKHQQIPDQYRKTEGRITVR